MALQQAMTEEKAKIFFLEYFTQQLRGVLNGLLEHCQSKCQQEPLRIWKAQKLFLRGGSEPLDYIHTYKNPEPRHWHYIGFGLSDIHGYSKYCSLHNDATKNDPKVEPLVDMYPQGSNKHLEHYNGFGFELTMRVKCNSDQEWSGEPPEWPRRIMQQLAKYVVQTRNNFSVGDHVSWHCPLDEGSSRIQHILFAQDSTLGEAVTTGGPVKFIQIVGACSEELQRAQEWSVRGILEMMKQRQDTGGPLLVTDMCRKKTIFELEPSKEEEVIAAIKNQGSDMVIISAKHEISYGLPNWYALAGRNEDMNDDNSISNHLIDSQNGASARPPSRMSVASESALKIENIEKQPTIYPQEIYILLDYRAASILPVMLEGRLAHGRHFVIQNSKGNSLIFFVPEDNKLESMVNSQKPIAKKGICVQMYVPNALRKKMSETVGKDFERLRKNEIMDLDLPKNYSWPEYNLHLTIKKNLQD